MLPVRSQPHVHLVRNRVCERDVRRLPAKHYKDISLAILMDNIEIEKRYHLQAAPLSFASHSPFNRRSAGRYQRSPVSSLSRSAASMSATAVRMSRAFAASPMSHAVSAA